MAKVQIKSEKLTPFGDRYIGSLFRIDEPDPLVPS